MSPQAYLSRFFSDEDLQRLGRENPDVVFDYEKFCPTCRKQNGCTYRWRGQVHRCDCQQQLHLHLHYLNAGIGATYQRLDWDDYHGATPIDELAGRYVDNHEAYFQLGIGLWLPGDFGTGKTMVANLMLKEFVRRGYTCFATTFKDTLERMTDGWHDPADKRMFARRFEQSKVLLLDDVGGEFATRLSEPTFEGLVRTRTQHARPTFVTTNLSEDYLLKGYGAAAVSLLKEKSIVQEFSGTDYRPMAHQELLDCVARGEVAPIV